MLSAAPARDAPQFTVWQAHHEGTLLDELKLGIATAGAREIEHVWDAVRAHLVKYVKEEATAKRVRHLLVASVPLESL